MYICYTDKYVYSLYERFFFWCPTLTLRPKTKICIITYTICVYHTAMPIISAHEDQHHICQHIYTYIYIWSTWPKAHSKNQTQINCNWTQINCNSLFMEIFGEGELAIYMGWFFDQDRSMGMGEDVLRYASAAWTNPRTLAAILEG